MHRERQSLSLEQKVLGLLRAESKVAQGWSEHLLVTIKGFENTVINALEGNRPADSPAVARAPRGELQCVCLLPRLEPHLPRRRVH